MHENNQNSSVNPDPLMSLDRFREEIGLSTTTIWRYRKMGMLKTINIYGRQYIFRSEVARFNARAAAGEFAKNVNPTKGKKPALEPND